MQSTLSAQFKDLTGDVGFFLGFGRGADNDDTEWTSSPKASIDRCVKGGLRKFYHCGYDWSFLKPVALLTLASGETTLIVPDDFGGFEGQLSIAPSDSETFCPIPLVGVGQVYNQQSLGGETTGAPEIACLEPLKGMGQGYGQRFQLRFWPTANQAYTIRAQYYINPDYLSGTKPYAYGGPQHAETILEACLSVAEKLLDDTASVHAAEFAALLQVSQDIDRRNKPQTLGYNRDNSDLVDRSYGRRHDRWPSQTTFNGIAYP